MFTQRLADALNAQGVRAEITWLPHRAEYAPWSVAVPQPPAWANVVHVNTWLHPRFIPRALPLVATMHHVVHDPAFAPHRTRAQALYHRLWIRRLEAAVLRRADAVSAVSAYTAAQVREIFGRADVVVIPNGVDTNVFHPGPDRPLHRPFRLLFVGNWSRRKGADLLPRIMRALGPGFELWVAGGMRGSSPNEVLCSNIRFLGHIASTHELVRTYQDADALLFPSRLEGFGLAALEAQACGLPVIATCGSALPEVVEAGETGVLCPLGDVGAFVQACRSLAENEVGWRRMRSAGPARARRLFSVRAVAGRHADVYSTLLVAARDPDG